MRKLLLLLFLLGVQIGAGEELVFPEADRADLLEGAKRVRMLTTTADIPMEVMRACRAESKDFALANPGEIYQSTDARIAGPGTPPNRRLIWGARLGTFCVMHYEKGGFVRQNVVVVTSVLKAGVEAEVVWSENTKKMNFEEFLNALKQRQFKQGAARL